MQRVLAGREDLDAKAKALVKAANAAGGPDNITVVLVEKMASLD
jgi:serine/threonine protein phosphatase PrpC